MKQEKSSKAVRPALREGMVVREFEEELLVYDKERHLAHSLNHSAAFIYRHCNGKHSVSELA